MKTPTFDQFEGCIIGCAIGDAVGAVLERIPAAKARAFVEHIVKPKDWDRVAQIKSARNQDWEFGQYTDDTQMSRILMESLVATGQFDANDYADRIAQAFARNQIVGYGAATQEAAVRLLDGASWQDSGTPSPRAGNGGAMRAAPIGLRYWDDSESLGKAAYDQAFITHQDPIACYASVVMALAVASALNASRETTHPGEYGWWTWVAFRAKALMAKHYTPGPQGQLPYDLFSQRLDLLVMDVFKSRAPESEIRESILKLDKTLKHNASWDGISPWALTSTLWALYAFMKSPKDFWQTMETALAIGGDTDSIAAMAGALSGAYNGYESIRDPVLCPMLHDHGAWQASDLLALARQLHDKTFEAPQGDTQGASKDEAETA